MFMFRMSLGHPFLDSLLKNHEPKESLLPEEPEFDPELPDFELPENIGELVEFVVVFEVLMVFWVFFELMLIPDASNLVATQLNSLVCKQAKVIITGKSEIKNKAKVSLDSNKCNSCQKLQKLHHIFDLNLYQA